MVISETPFDRHRATVARLPLPQHRTYVSVYGGSRSYDGLDERAAGLDGRSRVVPSRRGLGPAFAGRFSSFLNKAHGSV